jgi:hypothetical protein
MQDTQRPFDAGKAEYLLIRNRPLLLPRTASEISIYSNHSTLSPPKPAKMTLLSLQRLYHLIPLRPSSPKPQPPFHIERMKQSQTTKMTSDLTPASTITARLWHRRLAHHNNGVAERMIRTITERARALYWILKYLSSFGEKQSTRLHIFINACPTQSSQREIIAMAAYLHQRMPNEGLTRPHTIHHTRCCILMHDPRPA